MSLEVTNVRIKEVKREGKLKALASVTFNNAFVVNGIKVINGTRGLFVAMPSEKNRAGVYIDIAHPVNSDTRQLIENAVLDNYAATVEASQQEKVESKEDVKETEAK